MFGAAVPLIAIVLSVAQSAPQPPSREARAPATTAAVSGRVTEQQSGRPLPRVLVTLVGSDRAAQSETTTGADGRYEFTGLAPGQYAVLASAGDHRSTYLRQWFGVAAPAIAFAGPPQLNIDLKAGQARDGVDIALTPALAIEGRVFTQWDEPMANVEITVTRADGRAAFFRPAYSDDLGRYRAYGLMPGRYHVCAGVDEHSSDAATETGLKHVRTCHLAALNDAEASDVTLAGRDATGIDIRVQRIGGRSISGSVSDAAGAPANGAYVTAWPFDELNASGSATTRGGMFVVNGLTPGRYALLAGIGGALPGDPNPPKRDEERAYATADITAVDATGIALSLSKAITARGRVTFEGNAPPPAALRQVLVYAQPQESRWLPARPPVATLNDDMTFELRGLFRQPMVIRVLHLPDGWALKSVRSGGRDVSLVPTDFGAESDARLDLVVTDRVAQPSVRVADDRGTPLATFQVVAIPADPSRWRLGLQIAPGTPSPAGVVKLGTFVAGDYLVAAVPLEDFATLVRDSSRIGDLARIATPITLTQGDTRTIDLTLARLPDKR